MARVALTDVSKVFPGGTFAVDALTLDVAQVRAGQLTT